MSNKLKIAMEAISFQSDALFKEVTGFFEDMRSAGKSAAKVDGFKALEAILKRHTKAKVVITGLGFDTPKEDKYSMMVDPPMVNANNPVFASIVKSFIGEPNDVAALKDNTKILNAWIDLDKNQVGGYYAELPIKIYVPLDIVFFLSPEETAAVLLHEFGHAMVGFENMTRTITTNYALKTIHDSIARSDSSDKREHILMDIKQALKLRDLDPRELAKYTDTTTVQVAILNDAIAASRSELGSNIYDGVGFEYLADQYAARCGAQRALVTALDKTNRISGNDALAYRSTARNFMMESLKLSMLIVPFLYPISMLMIASDAASNTYDRPKVRLQRIRDQIVEELKQKNITPERIKQLKDDIILVDGVISEVSGRAQVFDAIAKVFNSDIRQRFKAEKFQQQLERLGSNDFFVKARELQTLD